MYCFAVILSNKVMVERVEKTLLRVLHRKIFVISERFYQIYLPSDSHIFCSFIFVQQWVSHLFSINYRHLLCIFRYFSTSNVKQRCTTTGFLTIYFYKVWAYVVHFQVLFNIKCETKTYNCRLPNHLLL